MYEAIGRPLELGNLRLKNRVVFAPTTLGLSEPEQEALLRRIAAGGCALAWVGDVPVGRKGFGSLFSRKGFEHYRRLTAALHSEGCLAGAQLHQSDSDLGAMVKYLPALLTRRISPDELRRKLNDAAGPYITGLPADKVRGITASFGDAAARARQAGFDLVQVHGDRMCGSFASSLLNRRTDVYGGSLENRLRFALEAVASVRAGQPDLPIDFKLVVRLPDYGRAGLLPDELAAAVPLLEAAGVTSFHVTLANHGSLQDTIPPANHPAFGDEGCFLFLCDMVRQYTRLPVCGVGGLTSPDFVEQQLAEGRIDCAAMSRQLIADPDWPKKVLSGRAEEVRRCVRCNKGCLGGLMDHKGVRCIFEGGNRK